MNWKKKAVIAGAVIIVICFAVFALMSGRNSSANRIEELMDLGNKYLTEQDYEQAIVTYQEVIGIDPKCEEAYHGLADAYIGMEDYEMACSILSQGIERIDSEELKAYLAEIEEVYVRIQEESSEKKANEEIEQLAKDEELQKEGTVETEENAPEDLSQGTMIKESNDSASEENFNGTDDSEEYDANGNLVKKSYWVDDWETYFYDEFDANGNLKKRSYWNEWLQVFIEEIYNEKGLLITVNQYEKDGSGAGSYEYEYDENGNQVRAITNDVTGGTSVTEYEYDADGNTVKVIYYNQDGTINYINEN